MNMTTKHELLKVCGNTHDPAEPDCDIYVHHDIHGHWLENLYYHFKWLREGLIGDPTGNELHTVEEMFKMDLVGRYSKLDEEDKADLPNLKARGLIVCKCMLNIHIPLVPGTKRILRMYHKYFIPPIEHGMTTRRYYKINQNWS